MIGELAFFATVAFAGTVVTRFTTLDQLGALAVALSSGAAAFVVVGVMLVVMGIPTEMPVVIAIVVLTSSAVFALRSPTRDLLLRLAVRWSVLMAGCGGAVVFARSVEPGRSTSDSYDYTVTAALLANGRADVIDFELLRTRLLGYPMLHLAAFVDDRLFTSAVPMVVGLATLLAVLSLLVHAVEPIMGTAFAWFIGAMTVLALATSYHFLFEMFYVNAHMAVGLFVLVALAPTLLSEHSLAMARSVGPSAAICMAALPLMRPEGGLLLLIVVVASVRCWSQVPALRVGAFAAGAVSTVWNGHLLRVGLADDAPASELFQPVGVAFLTVAVLSICEVVGRRQSLVRPLELTVLIGPWMALGLFAVVDSSIVWTSIEAFVENSILGAGTWGPLLPALLAAFAATAVSIRTTLVRPLGIVSAAFIPFMLILAPIRGTAYRVGPGDSLNRSLLHVLPAMLVVTIVSVVATRGSPTDDDEPELERE